jgi:hypothetical protein
MTDALLAAMLQARAACVEAALQTRTPGSQPADILLRAEDYWRWVAEPLTAADNRRKPAR